MFRRDPSSFTPCLDGRALVLESDTKATQESIAQFSRKDADAFPAYCATLDSIVAALDPLLDHPPPGGASSKWDTIRQLVPPLRAALALGKDLPTAYQFLTSPASRLLDRWFESDVLKATLGTDAIIGAMGAPSSPGSAYVLLHHGAWSVVWYLCACFFLLHDFFANACLSFACLLLHSSDGPTGR